MLKFIAIIVVAFTTCASAEENLLDGGLFSEVLQKAKSVTFYRPNQEPQFILNPGSPLPPGEKYEAGKDLKEFRDSFIAAKPFAPLGCIVEFAGMYEPSGFVAYDEERNPILVGAFNYAPSRKKMAVYIFAPSLNNGRPEFVFPSSLYFHVNKKQPHMACMLLTNPSRRLFSIADIDAEGYSSKAVYVIPHVKP